VRAGANGAPAALRKNGRWVAVTRVLSRHQTEDRWWTEQPVSRDYYSLLLEDDRVVSVFHDLAGGDWYGQRYG
jgi:hypothetical protein